MVVSLIHAYMVVLAHYNTLTVPITAVVQEIIMD